MTTAFPLDWPDGWPRTPYFRQRQHGGAFGDLTLNKACRRLSDELRLLGATDVVLSTSVPLRKDGWPRADYQRYEDSGVAVYFRRDGRQLCMAHDTWERVEADVNALALAIAGLRQMERHGGAGMVERAFTGFAAIGAPPNWWEVLDLPKAAPKEAIRARYHELAKELHPDRGGSTDAFQRVLAAYEEGMRG